MSKRNDQRGVKITPQKTPATPGGLRQPRVVQQFVGPHHRPTPVSQLLQAKMPVTGRPPSFGNRKPPTAPPVYRPSKALQPKVAAVQPKLKSPIPLRPAPFAQPGVKPMTRNVVQRVIKLKDQPDPVTDITSIDELMLMTKYEASPSAIRHLKDQATDKDTHTYANWASAVKSATEWVDPLARLKRSHQRNLTSKATPRNKRYMLPWQKKHNYGFDNKLIDVGPFKGSYRSSRGQPYLSLNKDNYGDTVLESDYDSLLLAVKSDSHSEYQIAEAILAFIDRGDYDDKEFSPLMKRAIATFVQLTQIIEPHRNRVPSADKWARACFSAILNGKSTFWLEFNRTTGNYLPARAKTTKKKKLSRFGGQESTRTFMGLPKKKTDRSTFSDVGSKNVMVTLEDLSDSSDEEMTGF